MNFISQGLKPSLVGCFGSTAGLKGTPLGGAEDLAGEGELGLNRSTSDQFSSGSTGWPQVAFFFIVRDPGDVLA